MKPIIEMRHEMLRWEPYKGKPGYSVMKVNREIEAWMSQSGCQAKLRMDLNIALHAFLEFETPADAIAFKMRWL